MRPRVLIVDDLFGRGSESGPNSDRENLCAHFLWKDVTRDSAQLSSDIKIKNPVADVVFTRGQLPAVGRVGDTVENDIEGTLDVVRKGWYGGKTDNPWSLVLLDLSFSTGLITEASNRMTRGMPEGRESDGDPARYFGLTLLDAIRRRFPELPVLILSSKPREEVSYEFARRGALGFIARDDPEGPVKFRDALSVHGLLGDSTSTFVAESLSMRKVLRDARRAARHSEPVLIVGERGAGKEMLARYLHQMTTAWRGGDKGSRPFITVNSAGLNPNLAPSELFGIWGKTQIERPGLIESAQGGVIFFDEVSDMNPKVQGAVLRVLERREINPVGTSSAIAIDVRFISATTALTGSTRPEFLDRIRSGGVLAMPALRDRREDIPLLAERFLLEAEAIYPNARRHLLSASARTLLTEHYWPGNVRELRAKVFEALATNPNIDHLLPEHFRIAGHERDSTAPAENVTSAGGTLQGFAATAATIEFPAEEVGQWSGQLAEILHIQASVLAKYVEAALQITRRRTPSCPEGYIQIHPAMKLATGNASLTASKAADLIKKLLKPIEKDLDGALLEAYEIAWRLRPGASSK